MKGCEYAVYEGSIAFSIIERLAQTPCAGLNLSPSVKKMYQVATGLVAG